MRRGRMGVILLQLSDRVSAWWHSLPERTRSVLSLVIFIGLIAAAGAIEGTAPSGMYY